MKVHDLEYTANGMFTRFMPNTPAGEAAWKQMNGGVIFSCHTDNVLRQLRSAGYSVRKAKPVTESTDDLLRELEA